MGLVEESSSGLSSQQLQQLLQVSNVKPILSSLVNRQSLTRERIGGHFVYFSPLQKLRTEQHKQRKKETERALADRALPPLDRVVALLVEVIQRPGNTPRQWARRLRQQGIPLGIGDIQAILAHYGIDLKKGLSKS